MTSSKDCEHQLWCVHIGWAILVVPDAHWPTEVDNGHGLHASSVASVYVENDALQCNETSAKAYMHQTWCVCIV